jgi:phosphoserine phosphatase
MEDLPWRLVTVDIDGTLTTEHGWWPIAVARGRVADYRDSGRALRSGREDENAHLARLFGLAQGMGEAEITEIFRRTHRVRGIAETVATLRSAGAHVALLTHNPSFVLRWYSKEFGFEGGSGGWGLTLHHGRVGAPRGVLADKVRGLRSLLRRFPVPAATVCHIGDAWPDARLSPMVGGFVAFNAKGPAVARVADAAVVGRDLRAVLPVLERIVPRVPVKGARPLDEPSNTRGAGTARALHGIRRP